MTRVKILSFSGEKKFSHISPEKSTFIWVHVLKTGNRRDFYWKLRFKRSFNLNMFFLVHTHTTLKHIPSRHKEINKVWSDEKMLNFNPNQKQHNERRRRWKWIIVFEIVIIAERSKNVTWLELTTFAIARASTMVNNTSYLP